MIENTDGTLTLSTAEVFEADHVNKRFAELKARVSAVRADPNCASTAEEDWGGVDLYPRIVPQDVPGPGVTIQPNAIPAGRTLVISAERDLTRPDRPSRLVMRVMLVRGPAPACVRAMFKRAEPFKRFTASAEEVVGRARTEAWELQHPNIGPEHILLGLLGEPGSVAARVLSSLNLTIERVRAHVALAVAPVNDLRSSRTPTSAPFTPRAMRILESASLEATELGNDNVYPEHILLGVAAQPDGVAARILFAHDGSLEWVRAEVIRLSERNEPPGAS